MMDFLHNQVSLPESRWSTNLQLGGNGRSDLQGLGQTPAAAFPSPGDARKRMLQISESFHADDLYPDANHGGPYANDGGPY